MNQISVKEFIKEKYHFLNDNHFSGKEYINLSLPEVVQLIEDFYKKADEERYNGFEEVVSPVMKWLAESCHPHMKIIIESNTSELVEGQASFTTDKFLTD